MKTIIVGVDGSEAASAALDVAAREATLHGASLRIVTVWQMPVSAYAVGGEMVFDDETLDALRDEAQHVADDAIARVRQLAPSLECTAELLNGQPAEELLQRSADADLVVVGEPWPRRLQAPDAGIGQRPSGAPRHVPCVGRP